MFYFPLYPPDIPIPIPIAIPFPIFITSHSDGAPWIFLAAITAQQNGGGTRKLAVAAALSVYPLCVPSHSHSHYHAHFLILSNCVDEK